MKSTKLNHILTTYFAPRGHNRMYALGQQIAQQYLNPMDKLIGIIGDAGSGKSALIRGMFPGLELTNDDNGVYVRPLPILNQDQGFAFFSPHTYHLDIRFENGFTQMRELADAIAEALNNDKRVVVEHFDLVYPLLGANANLLIGVGETIMISRPNIFGPEPDELKEVVYENLPYRLMAHTAEDLVEMCLPEAELARCGHDDVRHGFVIYFDNTRPEIDLIALEARVKEMIVQDLPVTYADEKHVCIGETLHRCTGPRIHVARTGMIENFHLMHHFMYDQFKQRYMIVGCIGPNAEEEMQKLMLLRQRPGWN